MCIRDSLQIYSNDQSLKIKNVQEGGLLVSIEVPTQQHRDLE